MQYKRAILAALAIVSGALAQSQTVSVSFDQTYDDSSNSLDIVACSDGPNGLESQGFTTFGSLPNFPNIGGAGVIGGFDSSNCGTCWQLTFEGHSVNVTALDVSAPGTFNIALEAFNVLTNGQGQFLGRVNATAVQVAEGGCDL